MNMACIPANYKGGEMEFVHCVMMLRGILNTTSIKCKVTKQLADVWKVEIVNLKSTDIVAEKIKDVSNFLGKIEILMKPECEDQIKTKNRIRDA